MAETVGVGTPISLTIAVSFDRAGRLVRRALPGRLDDGVTATPLRRSPDDRLQRLANGFHEKSL